MTGLEFAIRESAKNKNYLKWVLQGIALFIMIISIPLLLFCF